MSLTIDRNTHDICFVSSEIIASFVIGKKFISVISKMDKFIEQRICIKFCLKNEISCADALKMLKKCFGDETLSERNVYKWYKLFKEGREAVEDEPRSGRPSTSTTDEKINKIKELVLANRRLSQRALVAMVGISKGQFNQF